MINSSPIEFWSNNCKHKDHNHCASRWYGLGFEIMCKCECHTNRKEEALPLVGRPASNATKSSSQGSDSRQ